ncbi:MAG: serine protease [Bacteroidota bacterium]
MRATDLFDNYLSNSLSREERADFEQRLATDTSFGQAFKEHQVLLDTLNLSDKRSALKNKLKAIHENEYGKSSRIIPLNDNFARSFGKTAAVAATTALVAVLSTIAILSTGGYLLKQQNTQLSELNRKVLQLEASSDAIVSGITKPKIVYAPANLEGSAFALNNKGYIITSYHMVSGADSIFIMNTSTERTLAHIILGDPTLDLAILKINDSSLIRNWQVPFVLKEKTTDVGEKVFTLGYPRKDMVYGEGSLSSLSGYFNDTAMYQISIPVNPGNSGGPLLDDNGNVIGVIRGKLTSSEATGFAVKANEIIRSINAMANDSSKKDLLAQGKKSSLKNMKRSEQIKKINPYVFNVLVYKKD